MTVSKFGTAWKKSKTTYEIDCEEVLFITKKFIAAANCINYQFCTIPKMREKFGVEGLTGISQQVSGGGRDLWRFFGSLAFLQAVRYKTYLFLLILPTPSITIFLSFCRYSNTSQLFSLPISCNCNSTALTVMLAPLMADNTRWAMSLNSSLLTPLFFLAKQLSHIPQFFAVASPKYFAM